jgi:hypothetical protein
MAWWVGITGRRQELFFNGKGIHKYFHKVKPAGGPPQIIIFCTAHNCDREDSQSVIVCLGSFFMGVV